MMVLSKTSTAAPAGLAVAAVTAAMTAAAAPAHAQQPFYEGKQLTLIVGSGVGGEPPGRAGATESAVASR